MKRQLPVFKIQGPSDLFETAGDFIPGQEEFKADGIHYTYRTDSVVMTAEIDADENGYTFVAIRSPTSRILSLR